MTRTRAAGLTILALLATLALAGPLLARHDPLAQDLARVLAPPGADHWLGTDHLGRDLFARLAHALRLSCTLALLCVLSAALVGSATGLLAAWRGGWTERALVTIGDALLALPGLVLVLLVVAFAPGEFVPLYLGLATVMWVEYFRVVRATSAPLLASTHVEAARLLGLGAVDIVRRHLWPALAPVIGTLACFGAATAVLAMATLGFVGVGLQPPTPELGQMMLELLPHYDEAPLALALPVALLVLFLLGLTLAAGEAPDR